MDYDIGIMGDDNDLPLSLLFPQSPDQKFVNECVVQVIFRLIQHDRLDAVTENEGQQGSSLLAG